MAPRNPSHKTHERRYKQHSRELAAAAGQSVSQVPVLPAKAYLSMSDAEIDRTYWAWSKRERNSLKRDAAKHRLKLIAMETIKKEQQNETDKQV